MNQKHHCPSCGKTDMSVFYQTKNNPAHSVLLLNSREEALNYPTGIITLGFCQACGFISNVDFDESLHEYSARYEATQGFSPTFNAFHKRLAHDLIERYDLHNKDLIEIGCDKGDFITMLCELGQNRGVGFDPAYVPGRISTSLPHGQLQFVADFYSEKYTHYQADFVCCKMTLEHIGETADFVQTVRRSIGQRDNTIVFFQIPNASYVFGDLAFWDVYYEHCSYFSKGSLARLFRHVGFDVLNLWTDYDDQYLMIEARPGNGRNIPLSGEDDLAELTQMVETFAAKVPQIIQKWQEEIGAMVANGRRIVLWGGGSKAVSFLTTLGLSLDSIEYVVDINPNKSGTFMAGTGQKIVAPQFLQTYQPDVVIIMNPIYRDEIGRDLQNMGLSPQIMTV